MSYAANITIDISDLATEDEAYEIYALIEASTGPQWRDGGRCTTTKDRLTREEATLFYRMALRHGGMVAEDRNGVRQAHALPTREDIRNELAGRDLACWCPPPEPGEEDHCHAALLVLIANDYGAPAGAGVCDRCWNWEGQPDTHPRCPDCGQPWNRRTTERTSPCEP